MLDPTNFLDNLESRGRQVDSVKLECSGSCASRRARPASVGGAILALTVGISGFARPANDGKDAHVAPLPPTARETCEQARDRAGIIPDDDVRFVECGRHRPGTGEAFALGAPVYVPRGPSAVDARVYSPGHCEHGGGAITRHSIFYRPEHVGVAVACSQARCERRDAIGCRDLGALNWDDEVLPGVKKNEAVAVSAFRSGCRLGDADSCSFLAELFDTRHDAQSAMELYTAACRAEQPDIRGCREVAERLLKLQRGAEAKTFLMRACRGTTADGSPYEARREGCGLLADMAEKHGDVASKWEYLRLECAYGYLRQPACNRYGLMLLGKGDERTALPYLRAACGVLPADRVVFKDACEAVSRSESDRPRGGVTDELR